MNDLLHKVLPSFYCYVFHKPNAGGVLCLMVRISIIKI